MLRAIWEYLTYERYGRRIMRPAAVGMLGTTLAVGAIAPIILAACLMAPPPVRPAPTLPPPTATAVFATATAVASQPTATPAPLCPEDPQLWQLVEIQPFQDPKTSKPVRLLKPIYRIEPPLRLPGPVARPGRRPVCHLHPGRRAAQD